LFKTSINYLDYVTGLHFMSFLFGNRTKRYLFSPACRFTGVGW